MTSQLALFKKLNQNTVVFVSYDLTSWETFENYTPDQGEILAYLVMHSDGQIIDGDNVFEPLPIGAYFIEERKTIDKSNLPTFGEILFDSDLIEIAYSQSPFNPYDSTLYTTQIINKSESVFRVKRFTAYRHTLWNKLISRPSHSNMIGGWFSENDFKMWFGHDSDWINPNSSLRDYRSYGTKCVWLYEIQMESGQSFFIGSYPRKSPF